MTALRFQFFGQPCFSLGGAPIRLGRRKAVALAAYLAVTGKDHSRERLASLFWPEYGQQQARSSLRRTLSVMTKALGKFWLAIGRDAIGFRPHEQLWVDVVRFRELAARSLRGAESVAALEEAAACYTDPFLAGFTLADTLDFDDWQFEQTESFCREAALVRERLAGWYMDREEYPRAIIHARCRVELEPLNEASHRQLIQLYRRSNQRGFALRQYEKLKTLLQKELGVLPDEETSALVANIRTKQPAPEQPYSLPATNLPAQSTRFVGRAREINTIVTWMSEPEGGLLTLTGPGGIGKTRLALEAARIVQAAPLPKNRFSHGVFFLSIGDLSSMDAFAAALVTTFGLSPDEMREPLGQLLDFLVQRNCLLVLDNLEHLPETGVLITKMLNQAPLLKILATSRNRLMLGGEHLMPLSGLSCPDMPPVKPDPAGNLATEEESDAVALFLGVARTVRPDMELNTASNHGITQICALTQGMPLALILAAGWVDILSPEKIADEIRQSLDFLKSDIRDLPPHHQSMRAVFDSSWKQLSESEKKMLMTLSIFRDRFTLDAVAALTGSERNVAATMVRSLVRKSMLKANPETGRFEIHPLLRQYAFEKLADPNLVEKLMDTHGKYYLGRVVADENRLISDDMLTCRKEMDADFANIRQAWFRAVDQGDIAALARAATGLYVYFDMHTRYHEGQSLFLPAKELLVGDKRATADPGASVILLCWFDMHVQGGCPDDQSFSLVESFHDITECAKGLLRKAVKRGDNNATALALLLMGAIAHRQSLYPRAIRFFRLSLEKSPGIEHSFWVTNRMGLCWRAMGQMDRAIRRFKQSDEIGRRLGDAIKRAWSLGNIGSAELCGGNLETAESSLQSAGESFRRINAPMGMVLALEELGLIAFLKGDLSRAVSLADQALGISADLGFAQSRYQRARALKGLALVAAADADRGETYLEKVVATGQSCFTAHLGMTFTACLKGDRSAAERHLELAAKNAAAVHKPQLKVLLVLASAFVAVQSEQDPSACGLLSFLYQHPNRPTGLFRAWDLPGTLVARLKSRMAPGQFEKSWEQGPKGLDTAAGNIVSESAPLSFNR